MDDLIDSVALILLSLLFVFVFISFVIFAIMLFEKLA